MRGAASRPWQHSQSESWPRSEKEQWLWESRAGMEHAVEVKWFGYLGNQKERRVRIQDV